MFTSHLGHVIVGKVGYGAACLFAAVTLAVAGYAHKELNLVSATGQGISIQGSPVGGAMNILVMGLESRTDYEGNTLPNSLLTARASTPSQIRPSTCLISPLTCARSAAAT